MCELRVLEMDKELLIAAVFERTPIWDRRHKLHCNRNVIDNYWKEIGAEMKGDDTNLRKQWKYLRDQFAVELGKFPLRKSRDAADDPPASKWRYFNLLLFLKDIIKPRRVTRNSAGTEYSTEEICSKIQSVQPTVQLEENSDNEESFSATTHDQKNTLKTSVGAKKRQQNSDVFNASLLDVKRRKLDHSESESQCLSVEDDEHFLFFQSLLPHVKKIPQEKILPFRCRVLELVNKFSYTLNSHLSSST